MKLDHLVQYSVKEFSKRDNKEAMVFDNGVEILTDRGLKPKIQEQFVDKRLTDVVEMEDGSTRLHFDNHMTLDLFPGQYLIYDSTTEKTTDPNEIQDMHADLPPDPSPERISEGPTAPPEEVVEDEDEEAGTTE